MKKRIPRKHLSSRKLNITMAKTGEHCPLSGWWAPDGSEGNGHYIAEGSIMPAVSGVSVTWSLVGQVSSRKPKHEHPPIGGFMSSY
jgi:hypothetical protein